MPCRASCATLPWCSMTKWGLILLCLPVAGFMNSVRPLKRSIVMDLVPRSERGFWNGAPSQVVRKHESLHQL